MLEVQGCNVKFQMPALQYVEASVSNDRRLTPEHFPEVRKKKVELEWEVGSDEEREVEVEFSLFWLGTCFTIYIIDFVLLWGSIREGPSPSVPLRFDPVVSCRVIDEVTRMVS